MQEKVAYLGGVADRIAADETNWRDRQRDGTAEQAPDPQTTPDIDSETATGDVWAVLAHEAVVMRLLAIREGTLEAPRGERWFTTQETGGVRHFVPLIIQAEQAVPASDNLDLTWLRGERDQPAPRGFTKKGFQSARVLLHNARRGIKTVPASHNTSAAGKAGQARLAAATTPALMTALLRTRLDEILTAGTVGSDKNTISKFLRARHFYMECGLDPFRWRLLGKPSAEVLAEEEEQFGLFVLFATLYWGNHGPVMQAISAFRKVHMNLADIVIPKFEKAMAWAAKAAKRMHMECGPREERDTLKPSEMNAIQDRAIQFVLDNMGAADPSLRRRCIREAGLNLVMALVRKGSRPGAVAPGDEAFNSFWGGSKGKQLHWTKWEVDQLNTIIGPGTGWMRAPMDKSWFSRDARQKDELMRPVAYEYIPGEIGRYSVVQAAKMLHMVDRLQPGEIAEQVPAVRDAPACFGGTGKALTSGDFNTWVKQHWAALKPAGDKRNITGYSVRRTTSSAFNKAAAGLPGSSELRMRLMQHGSEDMSLCYDDPDACMVSRLALEAHFMDYAGVSSLGRTAPSGGRARRLNMQPCSGLWEKAGTQPTA